jgi:uncharacterized protein (TIGR00290 family)
VVLAWSGGKDSARALHELRRAGVEVACLLTTVTQGYGRVSIHGVRRELLGAQAAALDCPVVEVPIPQACSNAAYEAAMAAALQRLKAEGVRTVAFGDIFLEDLRAYRDAFLARLGLEGAYPLWGRPTPELAREFVGLGFRAVLACVDSQQLDAAFAGRSFDAALLADLPPGVDPCGERGEFHTFVHDGPGFRVPVHFTLGPVVLREARFAYCDLLPAPAH